jgi:putative Mn2+ efflux pump MntP
MSYLPYIIISLILSLVPFSVALSSSIYRCINWKETFRIAGTFAVLQAIMLSVGWLIGFSIQGLLYSLAVPVAIMIVFFISFRMIADSRRYGWEHRTITVGTRNMLFSFAFVTSINGTLLGLGLGMLYPKVLLWAGVIFCSVFLMIVAGIRAGKRGMINIGRSAELSGGLSLLVVGILILLQYLKIV